MFESILLVVMTLAEGQAPSAQKPSTPVTGTATPGASGVRNPAILPQKPPARPGGEWQWRNGRWQWVPRWHSPRPPWYGHPGYPPFGYPYYPPYYGYPYGYPYYYYQPLYQYPPVLYAQPIPTPNVPSLQPAPVPQQAVPVPPLPPDGM